MISRSIKIMCRAKKEIFKFAIISRVIIFILQCIFNILCPDHIADAFKYPPDPKEKNSICDDIINILFGGFVRWDGQYFVHIAKYGYTYENTLAFYPLYPLLIHVAATILKKVIFVLNMDSCVILSAVLINFICFVKSALLLYDLTNDTFYNSKIAYIVGLFYCITPANIFFSAVYSESMFAYLSFYSMLASLRNDPIVYLPIGLSTLVRSNGLVNIGFLMFYEFQRLCSTLYDTRNLHNHSTFHLILSNFFNPATFKTCLRLLIKILISLLPLFLLQIYNYIMFCTSTYRTMPLQTHIMEYGSKYNLILTNSGNSVWCDYKIPIAYSYVQTKYWNVGFLNYYELKQLPNFILALPMLFIMIVCTKEFFVHHGSKLCQFKFFVKWHYEDKKYLRQMFVYVIHGLFLTFFCIFFVHIQVSTRLLASASPLFYWYCALSMFYKNPECHLDSFLKDEYSVIKVILFLWKTSTLKNKLLLLYCLSYSVIGCFMFANFLPWT